MLLVPAVFKKDLLLHKENTFPSATMNVTSSADFPPPLLAAGAFGVGIIAWLLIRRSQRLPFPPGPSPDPVIGNLRHMGSGNLEFVFEKWGKEFGEFF